MRKWLPALALSTAVASSIFAAPQALAQESKPAPAKVSSADVAPTADAQTRALAAAHPDAIHAAAVLCGSGYKLSFAEPLPDATRLGTLFTYTKYGVGGKDGACALFDNNTGVRKHMKLKVCPNLTGATCSVDEGTFLDYAGPVKYETRSSDMVDPACSTVNALMWSNGVAIIDRQTHIGACD
jgi:hypothetical protein